MNNAVIALSDRLRPANIRSLRTTAHIHPRAIHYVGAVLCIAELWENWRASRFSTQTLDPVVVFRLKYYF